MEGSSVSAALGRIEAAIGRIENAAGRLSGSDPELKARHELLKSSVSQALGELDALIQDQRR